MPDIGFFDGDVLAYHACRPRWEEKDQPMIYDKNGYKKPLEFTPEEDAKYLEETWISFQKLVESIADHLWLDNYLMAVGGRDNFRKRMYPDYKMNRHNPNVKSNPFVPVIRQRAVEAGLALFADDREADDYLRTWATEAAIQNVDYVIVSIDKDLDCIPGKHFNPKREKKKFINEIEIISPEYAMRFYYQQLIQGDSTDKIPGVPGIGRVKAEKIIASCNSEEELQEAVVSQYIEAYDDLWRDMLLSNGKMIHIMRHLNDYFTIKDWPIVQELDI